MSSNLSRNRRAESCRRLSNKIARALDRKDVQEAQRLWRRLTPLLQKHAPPSRQDIVHGGSVAKRRAATSDTLFYDFIYYSDRWCGWRVVAIRHGMRGVLCHAWFSTPSEGAALQLR